MTTSRRQFAVQLGSLGASAWLPTSVFAQALPTDFPNKSIRYVVPFPPGGLTDVMARLIGQKLSEGLKGSVLVDNKPGANANLGADLVAKAAPDGYTWLAVTLAHAVNASLFTTLPYSIEKNLIPVAHLATSPLALVVNANNPAKTLKDFLEAGKGKQFSGGSSGNGTPPHLGLELLAGETKLAFTHIPYKGGAPSLNDLMGGQIDFIVSNLPECSAFIKSGKLRALAVTSAQRHALLPDVPTFNELSMPAMELENWTGMMMPAGTPRAIVEQVGALATRAAKSPEVADRVGAQGFTATGLGPTEFAAILNRDVARWRDIIKSRQIKPD
jgi:tripartite-type tricarboxylate transporter receptor subunit TctC